MKFRGVPKWMIGILCLAAGMIVADALSGGGTVRNAPAPAVAQPAPDPTPAPAPAPAVAAPAPAPAASAPAATASAATASPRTAANGGIVFLDTPTGDAAAAAREGAESGATGALRIILLCGLLVLGVATLVWMRKRQTRAGAGATPAVSVLGQVKVAGRWQVVLVRVPGKTLVLGTTDKGVSLLTTLEDEPLVEVAELPEVVAPMPVQTPAAKPDAAPARAVAAAVAPAPAPAPVLALVPTPAVAAPAPATAPAPAPTFAQTLAHVSVTMPAAAPPTEAETPSFESFLAELNRSAPEMPSPSMAATPPRVEPADALRARLARLQGVAQTGPDAARIS